MEYYDVIEIDLDDDTVDIMLEEEQPSDHAQSRSNMSPSNQCLSNGSPSNQLPSNGSPSTQTNSIDTKSSRNELTENTLSASQSNSTGNNGSTKTTFISLKPSVNFVKIGNSCFSFAAQLFV